MGLDRLPQRIVLPVCELQVQEPWALDRKVFQHITGLPCLLTCANKRPTRSSSQSIERLPRDHTLGGVL